VTQIAVYAIKNIVTGMSYVGSTIDWKHRKSSHLSLLRRGMHHSQWLQRAWNKYGESSFIFIPCFNVSSREEALHVEDVVLSEYFFNGLYNVKQDAVGFVGCSNPKTDDHKNAIGSAIKKSWQNEEIRQKRTESMKGKRSVVVCPHCQVSGGGGNMRRYHFDKCKENSKD
jgi:group I intron endonuclease